MTKIIKFLEFHYRINKIMKIQSPQTRIMKIMQKIIEFQTRIKKIMKIKLFNAIIMKINELSEFHTKTMKIIKI